MARGLVRKNNLSDLPSPEQARANLGLATADYNRIRGLFASAGISNVAVQRIANSTSNFQNQIDSLNVTLSGVDPSLYVDRTGDTIVSGWTNQGYIQPGSVVQSGITLSGSTDSLFNLTVSGLSYALSTSSLIMNNGLALGGLSDNGNASFASGVVPSKLVPFSIDGVQYYLEAG
jgi:hypothetical protein